MQLLEPTDVIPLLNERTKLMLVLNRPSTKNKMTMNFRKISEIVGDQVCLVELDVDKITQRELRSPNLKVQP